MSNTLGVDLAAIPSTKRAFGSSVGLRCRSLRRFSDSFLERVMNLAEKTHYDADSGISSVHRRSLVFRIREPFLSKFITRSRHLGE